MQVKLQNKYLNGVLPAEGGTALKDIIALHRKEMTTRQALAAKFILESPREAAFLTASQLGERVGVSETTVLRLSKLLGFPGYQELRWALASQLMNHLSTLERAKDYEGTAGEDLFERALQKDLDALASARTNPPVQELRALGTALKDAGAVYLAGYRSSYALVYYLSFYLSWILPNVKTVSLHMPFEMLSNAPKNALVLGISFPRYSTWTVNVLSQAKDLGLTTAAVTSDLSSPLADRADLVLSVPYKPISFIDSFAAPMSLLNCLILSVAEHLGEKKTEILERLESHWKEEGIYTASRGRNRTK